MQDIERPSKGEIDRLLERYGRLRRRIVDWDLRHLDEQTNYPAPFGEVISLILDHQGRVAAVKRSGPQEDIYVLPQGRIDEGEGVEEAAVRVALEATGMEVKIVEVAAIHRARIRFKGGSVERWYFIVLCSSLIDGDEAHDAGDDREAKFVKLPIEMPLEWARSQWYLWVLKDAGLLHPHAFLLGKAPS
ncbi:MAG: NUDIX domain-containing protein [Candidatus Thermoplasmatota archaeon]|nr:NUDIX domain-containing protein [Candidatus Thermoplasmatota archaeon]